MKRPSLFWHVFVAILIVALLAIGVNGVITKGALDASFEEYLSTMRQGVSTEAGQVMTQVSGGGQGQGSGQGQGQGQGTVWRNLVLGAAEEVFLTDINRGIALAALVALVLAALAAVAVGRILAHPLRILTGAARARASGAEAAAVVARGPAEVAELTAAFNDMTRSLDEAEALRRRMVADIAHELRNPIAALRAQIEGIADGILPADSERIASLVDDAGTLSRLVDEMQELSVAEAGGLHYVMEPFDVVSLVVREAERTRVMVRSGVNVKAAVPDTPVKVTGDEFRIAQVLRNLLGNASRHTTTGSITVHVVQEADCVRVVVADTGEGITAADLPHIWERFYRADVARTDGRGGAGMGLSIARRIVEDHGGSVFAESMPGRGSEIGFVIPLGAAAPSI